MRYRPMNREPLDRRLDRLVPDDFAHVEKWPLTAATFPSKPVPVPLGINWYSNFDNPEKDSRGRWWIGKGDLGRLRGGHGPCLEPGDPVDGPSIQDATPWWTFYDQGSEGACVGFGCSRMMSLLNRRRYFARWLWDRAKERDEWADTNPGDDNGTSVRAALDVLRSVGHVAWSDKYKPMDDDPSDSYPRSGLAPVAAEGISANRWATTVEQVNFALQSPANERMGAVRLLNSWGRSYPHRVWVPMETLQRLLDEDGEAGIPTDR
jgi:hypothetical protein